jgi:hypothetical protein
MLNEDELVKILAKDELAMADVILLHHHLDAIGEVQDTWGENIPIDVDMNLRHDLERIIARLKAHLLSKGIYDFPKKDD